MSGSLKRPADNDDDNNAANSDAADAARQRKFFPRLKTLLSDEYEDFLRQVIDIVEVNECAAFPMATADTPWADAFEAIYQTVASDYALPQGKNRLHKFKEKMIELWSAMQGEVTLGVKSDAHPIYRTALKQWKLHQSVMRDKTKAVSTPTTAAGPANREGGGDTSDQEMADTPAAQQRPRKKAKSTGESRKSTATATPAVTTPVEPEVQVINTAASSTPANLANLVTMPGEMMESWMKSLSRLELMLTASGLLPQRLPSPLYELHRLKIQIPEAEFDNKARNIYDKEIGRYLAHVTAQCRTSSQPGYLPHLLEGVDVLRRSPQSPAVKKSLDYTHKTLMSKYLKLIAKEYNTKEGNTTNIKEAKESNTSNKDNKESNNDSKPKASSPSQPSAAGLEEPETPGGEDTPMASGGGDGPPAGVIQMAPTGDEEEGGGEDNANTDSAHTEIKEVVL
ncbi:hypothetical protein ACA910_018092 [Epithemia clementina (nom. ined.)]